MELGPIGDGLEGNLMKSSVDPCDGFFEIMVDVGRSIVLADAIGMTIEPDVEAVCFGYGMILDRARLQAVEPAHERIVIRRYAEFARQPVKRTIDHDSSVNDPGVRRL